MKKLLLTTLSSLLAVAAFAQGTVTFQNASTVAGWASVADRNVKFGADAANYNPALVAGANVSSNYAGVNLSALRVALFFAPGTVGDAAWDSVNQLALGTTVATFKGSTSTTAGSWFGGTRSLNGVAAQGGVASLMVVVWDSSLSADPLSAAARAGLWGRSAVFGYTTPAGSTPAPAEFLPNNLASFTIGQAGIVPFVRRKRLTRGRMTIWTPTPQAEPFSPCLPHRYRNHRVTGDPSNFRRSPEPPKRP